MTARVKTERRNPTLEDMINKPPHYKREGAMETIDEMILIFGVEETMSFCKLNAWKYRSRALLKNGMEDLQKSDWYLRKYKELEESCMKVIGENGNIPNNDIDPFFGIGM